MVPASGGGYGAEGCGLRWLPGAAVVLSGSSRVTAVVPRFAADSVVT